MNIYINCIAKHKAEYANKQTLNIKEKKKNTIINDHLIFYTCIKYSNFEKQSFKVIN